MPESPRFDISDVLDTASRMIKNPAGFYRNMPRQGGYAPPLIFIVVMAITTGILVAILSLFGAGRLGGMAAGFTSIFIMPVAMIIGCFIAAAILYIIWKLLGSTQNYETAFRCQAFASSVFPVTAALSLIPYLGTAIAVIWGIWLVINASIEVHGIGKQKAMWVFGILGALMLYSNISSEQMARKMQTSIEAMDSEVHESMKEMENMSPEQAGQALGEFLKGLEQGTRPEPAETTE